MTCTGGHWPKKPVINIRMIMWAQFKKNIGNVEQVRDILWQLVAKYPHVAGGQDALDRTGLEGEEVGGGGEGVH